MPPSAREHHRELCYAMRFCFNCPAETSIEPLPSHKRPVPGFRIFFLLACDASVCLRELPEGIRYEIGSNVEFIVHMAAETHVDNSIAHPVPFVKNNVNSTLTMLEWARELTSLRAFFYFSTDEVYGPALNGRLFKEDDRCG